MKSLSLLLLAIIATVELSSTTHVAFSHVHTRELPKLMLYYSPSCPYSQKVLNYLKAIQKTIPMKNVYASRQVKEELIRLGGKAQVPCLMINGRPLYESDLIIQWLADNKDLY